MERCLKGSVELTESKVVPHASFHGEGKIRVLTLAPVTGRVPP